MSELVGVIKSLQAALDEHEARLARLETSPMLAFRMSEATAQRRRVVARLRAEGLSAERIARAVGAGRSTVWRDLEALGAVTPDHVVGVNGRAWSRRNGGAAQVR
jgi:DNA-binding NarL/FixJ family response regulator